MQLFEKLAEQRRNKPLNIILSTDWYTDCDDVAALCLLCEAHRAGAIRFKAVCADTVMPYTAASIDAVLTERGCPEIPLGIDRAAARPFERCRFQKGLAAHPHSRENDGCPDAVKLLRKILGELDGMADIISIGFPSVIANLLKSEADEFSTLDGKTLFKEKIGTVFVMGGKWDIPVGSEHNFALDREAAAAAAYLCDNSPVPLVFLGHEVGDTVITGGESSKGILGEAMALHGSHRGRCSWDPMTALLAVINDIEAAGYTAVYGKASVDPETGSNTFTEYENGPHCHVCKAKPDDYYSDIINSLVM